MSQAAGAACADSAGQVGQVGQVVDAAGAKRAHRLRVSDVALAAWRFCSSAGRGEPPPSPKPTGAFRKPIKQSVSFDRLRFLRKHSKITIASGIGVTWQLSLCEILPGDQCRLVRPSAKVCGAIASVRMSAGRLGWVG